MSKNDEFTRLKKALKIGRNFAFSMVYKAGFPYEILGETGGHLPPQTGLMSAIVHPDDYMPFCEEVNSVINGENKEVKAHVRILADGAYRWYYLIAGLERSDGNVSEFLGAMHDVSEYLECDGEDAVMRRFRTKIKPSYLSENENVELSDIFGKEYLEQIQQPFTLISGLYSAIVSPGGAVIAGAYGQDKSVNLNKLSYQRKENIRIRHRTAAFWVIASENLEDVNNCMQMLDTMAHTVAEIANSYILIGEETENSQNANKLLGENFEDQILINNMYSAVLNSKTTKDAFMKIIPLIEGYVGLSGMYFCVDSEDPVLVYHWDKNGNMVPEISKNHKSDKINKELDATPVVCAFENELKGEESERNRSCALLRIYENGNSKGVFVFAAENHYRTWTNRDKKMLRSITLIFTTLISQAFMEDKLALSQERLQNIAYRDAATGIPNRTAFEKFFAEAIKDGKNGAVISLEYSNYKEMTENYSCQYADAVIGSIAEYIEAIPFRLTKQVFRFSNDILFINLADADRTSAAEFAEMVLSKFNQSWFYNDSEHRINLYASFNLYPDDVYNVEDCITAVTRTLRLAKIAKMHDAVSYTKDVEERLDENLRVRKMLIDDAKNGFKGFYYLYSPVTDAKTDECICCESRLFWKNGDVIVSRDKFFPIIERLGMCEEIFAFAMRKLCAFCAEVRASGLENFRASFELLDFILGSDSYLLILEDLLKEYSLSPDAISISVSESTGTLTQNSAVLKRMASLGVTIISEDRGRSFLTETLFKTSFINVAKIGIERLMGDDVSASYVRSLIDRAHENGIRVCVRGVDNEASLELAKKFNVDLVQGIVNGRPLHSADFIGKMSSVNAGG